MTTDIAVTLDDHCAEFLASAVATGRYRSASDVVQAALRLLEDQTAKMATLRDALVAGEESGPATPFDYDAFIATKKSGTRQD